MIAKTSCTFFSEIAYDLSAHLIVRRSQPGRKTDMTVTTMVGRRENRRLVLAQQKFAQIVRFYNRAIKCEQYLR